MKKLITIIAFLTLVSISNAQTYVNVGNALQRAPTGLGYMYRFNMGVPGFMQLYTKQQVDSLINIAVGSGVTSFNTRTGVVVPLVGDYSSFFYTKTLSDGLYVKLNGQTQQNIQGIISPQAISMYDIGVTPDLGGITTSGVSIGAALADRFRAITTFTGSHKRWVFGTNADAETGGNAGSNFAIGNYNDDGTFRGYPLVINRATESITSSADMTINSILVGHGAGNVSNNIMYSPDLNTTSLGTFNIAFGRLNFTDTVTTGTQNTAIGSAVLRHVTSGSANTGVGLNALSAVTTGTQNVGIGGSAVNKTTTAQANTAIGVSSLSNNITGNNNTSIGNQSGFNSTGDANVFLGYKSGYNETGSNKLYISNSDTATPLVYGDFSTSTLRVNGLLQATTAPSGPNDVLRLQDTSLIADNIKGSYIQNQNSVAQTANFNINGVGILGNSSSGTYSVIGSNYFNSWDGDQYSHVFSGGLNLSDDSNSSSTSIYSGGFYLSNGSGNASIETSGNPSFGLNSSANHFSINLSPDQTDIRSYTNLYLDADHVKVPSIPTESNDVLRLQDTSLIANKIINATNGLTYTDSLRLGGALTQNTTIDISDKTLVVGDLYNSHAGIVMTPSTSSLNLITASGPAAYGYVYLKPNVVTLGAKGIIETKLDISNYGAILTDESNYGFSYAAHPNLNISPQQIPDIQFVDSLVNASNTIGANPSASIGLTAINGAATTFMRSDAAPAINQAITPIWTGVHTYQSNSIGTTSTDAIVNQNITNATSGVPIQYSGRLRFSGTSWNTTSSSSNSQDFIQELKPITGATTGSSLYWSVQNNGGGYTGVMFLQHDGVLKVNSIANMTTSNNALISLNTTGLSVTRNVADANNLITFNNINSSNTGSIAKFQFSGTDRFSIDNSGNTLATGVSVSMRLGMGMSSVTAVGALFHQNPGTYTTSALYGTVGMGIRQDAITYTSTTSSGTIAATGINTFASPTLAASSATTLTTASTFRINGAPIPGTNVTITSPYAFEIAGGNSLFGGNILPSVTQTYNLGALSLRWANLYAQNSTISTLFINEIRSSNSAIKFMANGGTEWARFFDATGNLFLGSTPVDDGVNKLQVNGSIIATSIASSTAATTQTSTDNSTKIATTAFVKTAKRLVSYTVATLPASPTQGDVAAVTDALAPTYLGVPTGGGTVYAPVVYNGFNWQYY